MKLIYYRNVVLQTILFIDNNEYFFQFKENRDVQIMEMIITILKKVFGVLELEDPLSPSSMPLEEPTALSPSSMPLEEPTSLSPSSMPLEEPTSLSPSSMPSEDPPLEDGTAFKFTIKDNGYIEIEYVATENVLELQKNRMYKIGNGHGVRFAVKMFDPVFAIISS